MYVCQFVVLHNEMAKKDGKLKKKAKGYLVSFLFIKIYNMTIYTTELTLTSFQCYMHLDKCYSGRLERNHY